MISTPVVRGTLTAEFDRADVRSLLVALETLQARLDEGEEAPSPFGVCSALDRVLQPGVGYADPYHFVRLAVEDWPEAIRNSDGEVNAYPVSREGGFWVGENRAARIRLIAHLQAHCEALLAMPEWPVSTTETEEEEHAD